jgi:hypothetical protein
MILDFNSQGNLHQTISLTYEEFVYHFGTNPRRMEQISNALVYFRIFYSCGCKTVYIDGSFISKKKYPEDIDLCFDLTEIDAEKLEKQFPQFFDEKAIGRIHGAEQCHILFFDKNVQRFYNLLQYDRDGNPKGFVKLNLKDLPT